MGNLIDTIGLREALRKTKSWCENKFAKSADFNEVSAQVSDNKSLLTEIKGTFTALQSGNADVTKAQVATNTGRITQAESDLNDLSLQVSGKANKVGSVSALENVLDYTTHYPTYTDLITPSKNGYQLVVYKDDSRANYYNRTIFAPPVKTQHKYLYTMDVSLTADRLRYQLANENGSGVRYVEDLVSGGRYSNISLMTTDHYQSIQLLVYSDSKTQGVGAILNNIQLFDLTDMFGAGNEPTTATEFANALGYASIDDVPYIPYSASAITMPNASSMSGLLTQKVMASEVCLGEYTLRCNGSSLVAVDSSGNETTLLGGASTMSLDDDTTTE